MRYFLSFFILLSLGLDLQAQEFTLADTLRGTLSKIRSCYDVSYYDLQLDLNIENRSISGVNEIRFNVVSDFDSLQIDLFDNMVVDSVVYENEPISFSRLHNAVFVTFPVTLKTGTNADISVYYHGIPLVAKNAPWDGGFVWKEDSKGNPWVGVACEGTGASLWWPNKDHLSDEPDSMRISCSVPDDLMFVSNGELEKTSRSGAKTTYHWKVSYPINNYNVTLNVADYAHFDGKYVNAYLDTLKLDYYVLLDNLEKAKKQFEQVPEMMDCFEAAFGPYPFYKDGYALVETPYLGMEHQGAIAYGNKYMPGYLGRFPGSMDFDYIIIHETGHEWWGNSVSMKDAADMWIHESFCTYSEAVFVECNYGYEQMLEYLLYQRNFINNRSPIVGIYGMNHEGNGGDMYYKGSWTIHTFRNVLNNDSLFRSILKGIAEDFAYQTVNGKEIINYISAKANYNYMPFFEQYLYRAELPLLQYRIGKKDVEFRWIAQTNGFGMPLVFSTPKGGEKRILVSNRDWTSVPISKKEAKELTFRDDLFLFISKEIPFSE